MGQLVEGGWTADHTEALRASVLSGLTYSQSAVEINKKYGTHYTRNSAIGRANRIGLQCPKKEGRPNRRKRQPYKPRRNRPKLVAPARPVRCEAIPDNPSHASLLELADDGCRWAFGDRNFTFCNLVQVEGSSYCPAHYRASVGAAA